MRSEVSYHQALNKFKRIRKRAQKNQPEVINVLQDIRLSSHGVFLESKTIYLIVETINSW